MTTRPRFTFRLPLAAFALATFCALGMTAQVARAQTYNVIHTFTGSDGNYPTSTLVPDRAGNLYGTSQSRAPDGGSSLIRLA